MSLKEKLRVVLNQKGEFRCPNGGGGTAASKVTRPQTGAQRIALVVANLQKRGTARPRTVKTLSSIVNSGVEEFAFVEVELK